MVVAGQRCSKEVISFNAAVLDVCGEKDLTSQQSYTAVFYMPVVLSLGISSAEQTFFFTATSQPPLCWHFI